jgi:peptide/nickel transport system permease protein
MLQKTFHSLTVFLGVIFLLFILFQWLGDPVKMVVGQTGNQKTIEQIRKEFYLDKPVWKRFMFYLNDLSPISHYDEADIRKKQIDALTLWSGAGIYLKFPHLGYSYQTKRGVGEMLLDALPGTIVLASSAILIAMIFGIGLGLIAALNKHQITDRLIGFIGVAGISAPSFFIALSFAWLFGILWHQYTGLPFTGSLFELDESTGIKNFRLSNLILPAITLGIRPMAVVIQVTRNTCLQQMKMDFVRTAYSKGVSKKRVIFFHVLPNITNPILTTLSGWFAELLAGSFFVEYIFGWKGIGKLTINALEKLDFPVVMGAILLSSLFFMLIQSATDFLLSLLDKRIT